MRSLLVVAAVAAVAATSPNMRTNRGTMRLADVELSAANRALAAALAENGVQTHILASGAVSLHSQAEVDEAQQWLDKFVTNMSEKLTSAVTTAVSSVSDLTAKAFSKFGTGPLAEELKAEMAKLPDEDRGKAASIMVTTESEDSQKGVFKSLIAYLVTVSNSDKLKELCSAAACIADPDVESCSPVEPLKSIVDWIDGKGWKGTTRKLMIKVTVYPLALLFASTKEAAVAFLGPAGRIMDSGIVRFSAACDFLDAATAYATCIQEKILNLSAFTQEALGFLGKGEFVKTLEAYDERKIGKLLSTKALLKCVQKDIGEPVDGDKLVELFKKASTGDDKSALQAKKEEKKAAKQK